MIRAVIAATIHGAASVVSAAARDATTQGEKVFNQRLGRVRQSEEPPPARLGRQLVEKAPEGVVVCRRGHAERGDCAVAQHDARVRPLGR
jgi:hypothetical protein